MQNHPLIAIILVFVLALVANVVTAAEDQPPREKLIRRYQLGPLVVEDFRGTNRVKNPRNGKDYIAYVETGLKWTARYKIERKGKIYTLRLTEIDIFSVIYPYECYNDNTTDRALMEDQQGHFDIAEIYAAELRYEMTVQIRRGKPLTVTGMSESECSEKLDQEMLRRLNDGRQELAKRHAQFDDATDDGRDAAKQKLHRDEQKKKLKALQEKFKPVE